MNRQRNNKKKVSPGAVIAIVVGLLLGSSDLFPVLLTIAIFAAILGSPFIIIYLAKKKNPQQKNYQPNSPAVRPTPQQQSFPLDDCPKPICFHKDKGEHHVKKGREIDPWDRPDIDISKYQRRE